MTTAPDLAPATRRIVDARSATPTRFAVLVALTGIDGSGKGFVTAELARLLQVRGLTTAVINVDGWLNLPARRFNRSSPAEHFYEHAIRFDEMFHRLVLPLRDFRSVCIEMDYTEETAETYRKHLYTFQGIDVILVEGIFLLKRRLRSHYDLSFWIDCSFETALKRAVARAQEGMSPQETVGAYETIYFPAQRIHFERDAPREAATAILNNDFLHCRA